jgi:hypothetical protein
MSSRAWMRSLSGLILMVLIGACQGERGLTGPQGPAGPSSVTSVADSGAVGDGITDDTAAINRALSAGGEVYFPPGVYRVTSTLRIRSASTLRGAGREKVQILRTTAGAGATLEITSDHVTITALSVRGPSLTAETFTPGETGIQASGAIAGVRLEDIRIRDCEVAGYGFYGIELTRVSNAVVAGNTVRRIGYAAIACHSTFDALVDENVIQSVTPGEPNGHNAYGITFTYVGDHPTEQDPVPQRCIATGNSILDIPTWEGLDTHDGQYITFSNNIVEGCRIGISAGGSPGGGTVGITMHDISITGNTIAATSSTAHQHYGIVVTGRPETYAYNLVVANNIVQGYGVVDPSDDDGALEFYETGGLAVTGNVVKNFATAAIMFAFDNTCFVCSGNFIDSGGTPGTDGIAHAIRAKGVTNWGLITGNRTTGQPISVSDASRVLVSGNY